MRAYYSEYVQHCMRFYSRYPNPQFRTRVDMLNWFACKESLEEFSEWEQKVLERVYKEKGTIPDNVYNTARDCGIDHDIIWKLISSLEQKVATRRQLI